MMNNIGNITVLGYQTYYFMLLWIGRVQFLPKSRNPHHIDANHYLGNDIIVIVREALAAPGAYVINVFVCNLRTFVISLCVCPWQTFPD
jgi:hypothetical protein